MSIVKPYTFVAGNKARANEVNEDFDILYQQVNANITNIANVEGEIQNLSSTKANINGDSTQRFAVADPVSSGDAINKRTLFRQIGNSIDYIGGLTISKDSGSPNDTILIDPGAAYDSTKTVVLSLDVLTSKQNTTQAASTTYYVYIIGNATGSSINILISTEASVPTLPAGYTLYRQIGSYTTNALSNIDIIYQNDGNKNIPDTVANIVKTYINGDSGYRIWSDGYCEQWGITFSTAQTQTIYLPKTYTSNNYIILTTFRGITSREDATSVNPANNYFILYHSASASMSGFGIYWKTCGYIS